MAAVSSCGGRRKGKWNKDFTLPPDQTLSHLAAVSLLFFFIFALSFFLFRSRLNPFTQTHTHSHTQIKRERETVGAGGSYKDTIVGAVSKGDLSKELWCAVISPTSVGTARADACDWLRVGWFTGGEGVEGGLAASLDFIEV